MKNINFEVSIKGENEQEIINNMLNYLSANNGELTGLRIFNMGLLGTAQTTAQTLSRNEKSLNQLK